MTDQVQYFVTGAKRGTDASGERWDLITPIGLRRIAQTYAEGARKYGVYNWQKGIPLSDLLNHAIRHIYLYLAGDTSEDHLAHAVWNLLTAMHFEETAPSNSTLLDIPSRYPYAPLLSDSTIESETNQSCSRADGTVPSPDA